MDDFMLRALLAGVGTALVTGPLGAFIVWRRMAYFGDTLAHSALLGVALGLFMEININLSIIFVCALLAVLLVTLQHQRRLASDTLLGILSHSALSLGLVSLAFMHSVQVDLMSYLFGDILAVSLSDIVWIYGGGLFALLALIIIWRPLLAITVHEELARVEGVPVATVKLVFMLLVALIIALSMKVVGILLVTSLLIIPAATARGFAKTPEQMALLAALIGCLAVGSGLFASLQWDLPAGPAVVMVAALFFFLAPLWPRHNQTHVT